ncbi:DEAD/DEAH box helicase [Corynebacterium sp. ES2794-CONJ1]|uniref:DEAD/DEAH box helicase n=1 Tax=Corynebacterium sp. ES2794-CONJ1 TaxID=2980553 RepID=UPI0021D85828|nr:DEAD/DEAH box helicase [Corynebacterium sp. ES2794-CONJ1]MCU9519586.1 DEAD/DEAH box helicase [Corynebacterium sp. ES2794-CONJ1]
MNQPAGSPNDHPRVGAELAAILADVLEAPSACHTEYIPPQTARYGSWPDWAYPPLVEYFSELGITRPYEHQILAAESIYHGKHTVIATSTSSGKSLGYLLPSLSVLADDKTATALYLTPTKALGSDQLRSLMKLTSSTPGFESIIPAPYDGDTPIDARADIRARSRFIFSTPDMLHSGILSNHHKWRHFLSNLRFLIIDESHVYRGIFGAHIALTLRRLLRIAHHYQALPTVVLASATQAQPELSAAALIGAPVQAISSDTAPHGARTILLWEPGISDEAGKNKRPALGDSALMMATLIKEGARTLGFVRSRGQAERLALRGKELLASWGRFDLTERLSSYRAGYLAEDRRALEAALSSGDLLGVASTNALELGIDIGGIDAVITTGFPRTISSFWQQAGRAGRRGQSSLVIFVAYDDPLDTYLVRHPDKLLSAPVERTVFDPSNPYILSDHLLCAASEKPLDEHDIDYFQAGAILPALIHKGLLRTRPSGYFLAAQPGSESPHQRVSLRSTGSQIMIVADSQLLGTVGSAQAPRQLHPGAVYVHQGEYYVVDSLDLERRLAIVHPENPDYYTVARNHTDIMITAEPQQLQQLHPGVWLSSVEVEVVNQVTGYSTYSFDRQLISSQSLDLPCQRLMTKACAYTVDPLVLRDLGINNIPGTLHAAEHAAIGMLPLIATCDRSDIGGVSIALHPDTELPTVFVYDGAPGGAGFADQGYEHFAQWIHATYETVRDCACDQGCPSCVQSPKCGNGNDPLDKEGAMILLEFLSQVAHSHPPGASAG